MPTALKFLLFYSLFLFILIYFVSTGIDVFAEDFNLEAPMPPEINENLLDNVFNTFSYWLNVIAFWFELMTVSPEISFLTALILAPFNVVLMYIFITKLLIPFLHAVGSVIPFT